MLVDFIQEPLAEGTTYTALATAVGTKLGHQYTELLERVATTVERLRTERTPMPSQYPAVMAAHGHQFGALVLALNRLELTEARRFPTAWKSGVLSSKIGPGGPPGGSTGGNTGGNTGAPPAVQPAASNLPPPMNVDEQFEKAGTVEQLKPARLNRLQAGGNPCQASIPEIMTRGSKGSESD